MAEFKLRQAQKSNLTDLAPRAIFESASVDFVPFSSYYNKDTIISKNGELMKVIRITGFNHESISSEVVNLRSTIRESILKNIKTDNFALWISTIRRRKDISPEGEFDDFFSKTLNDVWNQKNQWQNQFVNELYITVIIEGFDTSITNIQTLFKSFSLGATKDLHTAKMNSIYNKLDNVVNNIVHDLNVYGAKVIGITDFNGQYYSEPLRFLGKIINLTEDRYPLTTADISEELVSNYEIAFGNNSLAVTGNNQRHYATMFSVKEYQEISLSSLDKFLQLPQEFIITQSVDFIDRNRALAYLDYQNYILDISKDTYLRDLSGLENIIAGDLGSVTDYGEQQITIMLINKTTDGLSKDIRNSLEKLHELGLVTVREDIFSEHCFWSQLPGNFSFLRRKKPINISRIAGFASLHNFPAGNRSGNYWGNAVTIFRTILGTPYFFNFHEGKQGHTMIIGPIGSGKTTLLDFLLCQARKFRSKIYYFGHNRAGKIFINAIDGCYWTIDKNFLDHSESLKLNPLTMVRNDLNNQFLQNWFGYLVNYGAEKIDEKELALIPEIVNKIIEQDIKKLSDAAQLFKTNATKNIYKKLAPWHSDGAYAFIFDHEVEANFDEHLINAIDLTVVRPKKPILIPVISYLMHRIEGRLDGSPTILALDEAWGLLDNYVTGPGLKDFLIRLKEKNCIVVFATRSTTDLAQSNITNAIDEAVVTQIFMPNPEPTEYYKTVFGLNDEEFELLTAMSQEDHHFLLKRGEDSIIAALDLSEIYDIIAVLSATEETRFAMDELKKRHGRNAKDWLPKFLQLITKVTGSDQTSLEALEEEKRVLEEESKKSASEAEKDNPDFNTITESIPEKSDI